MVRLLIVVPKRGEPDYWDVRLSPDFDFLNQGIGLKWWMWVLSTLGCYSFEPEAKLLVCFSRFPGTPGLWQPGFTTTVFRDDLVRFRPVTVVLAKRPYFLTSVSGGFHVVDYGHWIGLIEQA
jgi:hypothetical protein